MSSRYRVWLLAGFTGVFFLNTAIWAQTLVPVSEIEVADPQNGNELEEDTPKQYDDSDPSDTFSALQLLRAQVQELTGAVETLDFRLQQVKQQQLDDYLDLDRRISALPSKDFLESRSQKLDITDSTLDLKPNNTVPSKEDSLKTFSEKSEAVKEHYDKASSLLLKERDMEGAVLAFKAHIAHYPDSPFVANASYWLGEIYLLQGLQEQARQEFLRIVDNHPGHSKEMDARFKLGKIYHELGNLRRSKELLETASKSSGAVASKAQRFLDANF